jgi:tetratricopeptide (TPR) repeat protein
MSAGQRPSEPTSGPTESGVLDPLERRVLVYASALGPEFDFTLLAASMGAEEEPLVEALERLVARGVFRERAGGDRFGFVDNARRGQIYRTLTQSRLRVVHRKIAEAMEAKLTPVPPEIVAELGRHFFLGRVPEKSYQYNIAAADLADQDGALEVAALHLERARIDFPQVPNVPPDAESRLAERLGHLYYAMGDLRAAARLLAEGLDGADPADLQRRAGLWVARSTVAGDLKDPDAAMAGAQAARSLYETLDDTAGLAVVHRRLARISFQRGRYQEALDEGMLALELLQRSDDRRTQGVLSIDLGNTFRQLDPELLPESVAWYDRAIQHLEAAGDAAGLSEAYLERGRALAVARPVEALDDLAKSRSAADRARDPLANALALLEAVPIRLVLGQVDEAERDNQLAESLLDPLEAPEPKQRARLNAGFLREREGQWEAAELAYRDAIDRAQRRQDPGALAEAQFCLARLCLKTRELAKARAAFGAAAELRFAELRPGLAAAFEELGRQLEGAGTDWDASL